MNQRNSIDATNGSNVKVFDYVKTLSAHPDLAEILIGATKPLGDVQIQYPNPVDFGAVIVCTKGIIFGFAAGTDTIAFKLAHELRKRALAVGALEYQACGSDWVSFDPFCIGWPKNDFEFWARNAYSNVRETTN